jgi:L-asparaginase II
MAAILARFLPLQASEHAELSRFVRPVVRNWNGIEVGALRVTDIVASG